MLINEFKIGNTLEDQDDKKQQKKKISTLFSSFLFPFMNNLSHLWGRNWSNFLQKKLFFLFSFQKSCKKFTLKIPYITIYWTLIPSKFRTSKIKKYLIFWELGFIFENSNIRRRDFFVPISSILDPPKNLRYELQSKWMKFACEKLSTKSRNAFFYNKKSVSRKFLTFFRFSIMENFNLRVMRQLD